jgi:hypothetical protein
MLCERFLEEYSDFRDGLLSAEQQEEFERHLETCMQCSRYHRVVQRGLELLTSLPPAHSSGDFMPRLRHRLYNVDDGILTVSRNRLGGSAALVGVAAVGLLALFWLPFAATVPVELELPPVAAKTPRGDAGQVPSLFRHGPFVSTLLNDQSSVLDGELVEWPPRLNITPTIVRLEGPYRRAEGVTAGR